MGIIMSREIYEDEYQRSILQNENFWGDVAKKKIRWIHEFNQVKDCDLENGLIAWYLGGKLNASENCIDRHIETKGDKVAIIWEGDHPEKDGVRKITYRELQREVCKMANVLRHNGIRKGDRVAIYMSMVPEAAFAMLACARLGAVHNVVFAGFSAEALRDRINDSKCKAVITCDEGLRGGRVIPLKRIVDEAVMACPTINHVFMVKRTGNKVPFYPQRDLDLTELMKNERPYCPIEHMDSEDTLFILYTSGSTGKPKGISHTTGGYLVYSSFTHEQLFNIQDDDIFACMADIGWVTGHSYIVYGPLSNGATTFMFEGTPMHPHPGRYWEMVERHKITKFYTAPTALRSIAKEGDHHVSKYKRDSLKILGTVGENIDQETWSWYFNIVGEKKAFIVDTWWQTETGACLMSPLPQVQKLKELKPGSAMQPMYGISPVLLSEKGEEIKGNDVSGLLAIKGSWPSMARTIQNDHIRFVDTYLNTFPGYYLTGDGAKRDSDGHYWITGRVDDVLNVSGHRIGTSEVESALISNPVVAEVAVVGRPHSIKGESIYAFIVLKEELNHEEEDFHDSLLGELKNEARHHIGPFATPDNIRIVKALPKTRSGKVMRRILKKIASGEKDIEKLGDFTTLADPNVVRDLLS